MDCAQPDGVWPLRRLGPEVGGPQKAQRGRGRGPGARGVHRRRGSARCGELRRGLKPRRLRIDEAKPDPKHHWPDPSRLSAPLLVAAASMDAQWFVVRVPEPLEPFVAIGSGLMMPGWPQKAHRGRGRGLPVRGVHRRRGSARGGELRRGLKPRRLSKDEA